jgi:hypothetical protein
VITRFVLPLGLLGALWLVVLSVRDRLPSPMGTHWGLRGDGPNGHLSLTAFAVVLSAGWLLLWFITLVLGTGSLNLGRRSRPLTADERVVVAYGGFGFLSGTVGAVVAANLDNTTWQQAELPIGQFLLTIGAGAAVGALAGWALTRLAD